MRRFLLGGGPSRSLALGAAGAVAGLAIAGYGLFTAKGTMTSAIPAEDIALVNSQPLLIADFEAQLQNLYGIERGRASAEQKRKVLNDMIREELFVQRGLEINEPSVDPDVRAALVNAVDQQVVLDAQSRLPSADELRAFYERNKAQYASEGAMLLHDLVPSGAAGAGPAEDAVKAMRGGMAVDDAMARFGFKDSGKLNGEEFYFAAKIHLGDALFAQAARMRSGEIAEPVEIDGTPHVLVMTKNAEPTPLSFEKARSEVLSDYQRAVAARVQAGEEEFLRRRAVIQVAPEYR